MIVNRPQAEQKLSQKKSTWMDTAQLVVSILVVLVFFGISILSFVGVAVSGTLRELREAVPAFWTLGFGFLFLTGIALVSAISTRQVYYELSPTKRPKKDTKWLYFSIAILPLLIAGGYFVINAKRMPAFLLPLITVLALSVAMLWILKLGLRDSWGANVKRDSGLFSFSMSFSTFYILLLQIFIFAIVFAIAMAFFFKNVDFGAIFENLIINPEMQIEDIAIDSDLVLLVLFMVAFSVPLIEELFKTIGVWFLKPRKISPREGWIAGLMSGAGFGLIEAYLYSMQGVMMTTFPDWLYFILGRTGGLLLHTFAGGIVGWGLAKSWREKRPTYAVGAYIVALLTHSLWNSIAVGQAVLLNQFDIEVPDVAVYISLGVLFVAMLVAYLTMSQNIAREPHESITEDKQARPYLPQDPAGTSNWSV